MRNDRPLTRRARVLSSAVRRECRTASGIQVVLRAYMRGARPTRVSAKDVLTPATIELIRESFVYLRNRIAYRGSWVVEICDASNDRPLAERVVPNRSSAMEKFEETRGRLAVMIGVVDESFLF